ncbi:MAG TPA: hypothetical protein VE988_04330 [Gemmataceae bacterium]|nr:hypothetical protein [Gemmataceae bacterium]
MTLSKRDKVLVVILPAVLILLGYGWTATDKHKRLAAASQALDAAQKQAPPPEIVRAMAVQVDSLSRDLAKKQKDVAALKQRWDDAAVKCGSAELRNDRIKKLTALLMQHRLTVLDDSEAEGSSAGKLPVAMEQLAQQLAQTNKNLKPQLRQLHLHGSYLDMHQVLKELSEGEVLAIPVGLSMKANKDGGSQRDWTLLVWI